MFHIHEDAKNRRGRGLRHRFGYFFFPFFPAERKEVDIANRTSPSVFQTVSLALSLAPVWEVSLNNSLSLSLQGVLKFLSSLLLLRFLCCDISILSGQPLLLYKQFHFSPLMPVAFRPCCKSDITRNPWLTKWRKRCRRWRMSWTPTRTCPACRSMSSRALPSSKRGVGRPNAHLHMGCVFLSHSLILFLAHR